MDRTAERYAGARARRTFAAIATAFFLSGLGSLALEVVWTRQLRLVFGSTTLAASTILVAYMLGLGIGGLFGGRVAGRLANGVRAYGLTEVAIGVYAVAVPPILGLFPAVNYHWLAGLAFWPAALCRFALALLVLLVPTVLMGATLPILVAALVRLDPRIGRSTAALYGVNTLGAVAGVFLATFALFPAIGLWRTNLFGASVDVLVGVFAIAVLARRASAAGLAERGEPGAVAPSPTVAPREAAVSAPTFAALATYAIVGFTALVYEVAWNRALSLVLGSSIYAFAAMLGAFLTGIALGSLLVQGRVDRLRRPLLVLVGALVSLAALALATTLALPRLPDLFLALVASLGIDDARLVAVQVLTATIALLLPTMVLGALFPLLTRIVAETSRDAGRAVGRVYFANTVGSASGAFAAGFFLLPWLGLAATLALAASLNLAAAGALLVLAARGRPRLRAVGLVPIAAAVVLNVLPLPFDTTALARGVFRRPVDEMDFGVRFVPLIGVPREEVLLYRDGMNTTVSVHHSNGATYLKVNGKTDASTGVDLPTQVLLGQIPMLFGPPAANVLVIGYASGVTVGAVANYPVARIDAVEIEPAIVEASHFFDDLSGRPLDDPRVRLVIDDGRTYLSSTHERFDVIVSEPSNPWMSGVANLFTREFFRAARAALTPDGRLMQWVQLYAMEPDALAAIVAALRSEFSHVYGFVPVAGSPDLLLLALQRPLQRKDLPEWGALPPAARWQLQQIGVYSTPDLWSLMRLVPEDLASIASRAEVVNTDDNLFIELRAPRMLQADTVQSNWRVFQGAKLGPLGLYIQLGIPIDNESIGTYAYSFAAGRSDLGVAMNALAASVKLGKAGNSIAAAVVVGRQASNADEFTMEQQLGSLDEAVEIAPTAFAPRLLRAEVRLEHDLAEGALEDLAVAAAARPDDPRVALFRARALLKLRRMQEARSEFERVVSSPLMVYDPSLWQDVAQFQADSGQLDAARGTLERYLGKLNPGWAGGWDLLADVEDRLGNADDAERARQNAQRALKNSSLGLVLEARRARFVGRVPEAEVMERAAALLDRDAGGGGATPGGAGRATTSR